MIKDEIQGWVTAVIDGKTFEMEVTHVGAHNRFRYYAQERVRLPATSTRERLRSLLEGMAVICRIDSRDESGRVVVEVAMPSYLPSPTC